MEKFYASIKTLTLKRLKDVTGFNRLKNRFLVNSPTLFLSLVALMTLQYFVYRIRMFWFSIDWIIGNCLHEMRPVFWSREFNYFSLIGASRAANFDKMLVGCCSWITHAIHRIIRRFCGLVSDHKSSWLLFDIHRSLAQPKMVRFKKYFWSA